MTEDQPEMDKEYDPEDGQTQAQVETKIQWHKQQDELDRKAERTWLRGHVHNAVEMALNQSISEETILDLVRSEFAAEQAARTLLGL